MYTVARPLVVFSCTVFTSLLVFNVLGMFYYIAIVDGHRTTYVGNIRRICLNRGRFHRLDKLGRLASGKWRTMFVRKSDFACTINERKPNDGFNSV